MDKEEKILKKLLNGRSGILLIVKGKMSVDAIGKLSYTDAIMCIITILMILDENGEGSKEETLNYIATLLKK